MREAVSDKVWFLKISEIVLAGFITDGISAYEQGTAALAKTAIVNGAFSAEYQIVSTPKSLQVPV